jgi:hypothetical protein
LLQTFSEATLESIIASTNTTYQTPSLPPTVNSKLRSTQYLYQFTLLRVASSSRYDLAEPVFIPAFRALSELLEHQTLTCSVPTFAGSPYNSTPPAVVTIKQSFCNVRAPKSHVTHLPIWILPSKPLNARRANVDSSVLAAKGRVKGNKQVFVRNFFHVSSDT